MIIGGTLHTVYPVFEQAEQKGILKIERAGTYENLFRRLLGRRIDAVPQVSAVGSFLVRTRLSAEQQAMISVHPTIIQTRHYALILSKAVPDNRRFLKLFNKGLAIIRNNGTYDLLKDRLSRGGYDHRD